MPDRPADPADQPAAAAADGPPPTSSVVADDASGWQRWSVLLPALTFVVGLVLGAVVVGVSGLGDDGAEGPFATASPSADPTPSAAGASPGAVVVTVPAPCVEAAEKAEVAYAVIDDAVEAVRELDARLLADVVDQAQVERAEIEGLVEACREEAGMQLVEPAVPTPTS